MVKGCATRSSRVAGWLAAVHEPQLHGNMGYMGTCSMCASACLWVVLWPLPSMHEPQLQALCMTPSRSCHAPPLAVHLGTP